MEKEEKKSKEVINKLLKKAGWKDLGKGFQPSGVTGFSREYPTASGPADYALLIKGKPMAVVEVKAALKNAYAALTQAKRYAEDIKSQYKVGKYNIPFVFTSNSKEIWFQDLREDAPRERKIRKFYTSDSLEKLFSKDYTKALEWLENTPIVKTDKGLWPHQVEAIEEIEKSLKNRKQRMLVQMATGTGKTRMAIAEVYRLLKSGYINKALFVVDRIDLVRQATEAFKNYDVGRGLKLENIYKIGRLKNGVFPENAKIVIASLQGMYSLINYHDEIEFDVDEFDFIISDECHRSIYGDWRPVLNHFDAIQLGLTATPATHTVSFFNENWIYKFKYWEAVDGGYLVPYETYKIETDIAMKGLFYKGKKYEPKDLERKITVPDTNRKIAKEFRKNSKEDSKTLIFAKNDFHAIQLERIFREVYSDKDERYVRKITYTTDRPHEWIKKFRIRRYPKIAITVDMISTGIDVKPIENLVFIRPTQSPILYNQMVGRGTRKCKEIGKEKFTIYDCIGIVEYFKNKSSPFGEYRPIGMKYPSAKRKKEEQKIIIADDIEDEVTFSGYVFSTEDGRELKPKDYASNFENYIKKHKDEIEALRIMLKSPKDLKRKHIKELNRKLRKTDEKFTEKRLQAAYQKPLVDIIGFVKNALGIEEFPTTKERIEKAFNAWMQEHKLSKGEREWLELIKRHFVRNKTIKREDFELIPFSRHGGWNAAASSFGGENELQQILDELNHQVILGGIR